MCLEPKLEILPPAQLRFWRERNHIPPDFVLYGGTAIALRLGHRSSEDFDFFSSKPFQVDGLLDALSFGHEPEFLQRDARTLTLRIERAGPVKLSFFGGPPRRVAAPDEIDSQSFKIATLRDFRGCAKRSRNPGDSLYGATDRG
jgi:hypothetical protein